MRPLNCRPPAPKRTNSKVLPKADLRKCFWINAVPPFGVHSRSITFIRRPPEISSGSQIMCLPQRTDEPPKWPSRKTQRLRFLWRLRDYFWTSMDTDLFGWFNGFNYLLLEPSLLQKKHWPKFVFGLPWELFGPHQVESQSVHLHLQWAQKWPDWPLEVWGELLLLLLALASLPAFICLFAFAHPFGFFPYLFMIANLVLEMMDSLADFWQIKFNDKLAVVLGCLIREKWANEVLCTCKRATSDYLTNGLSHAKFA